jgi:hypothetical protein
MASQEYRVLARECYELARNTQDDVRRRELILLAAMVCTNEREIFGRSRCQLERSRNILKGRFFLVAYWPAASAKKATFFGCLGNLLTDLAQPSFKSPSIVGRFCINQRSSLS